MRVLFLHQNFPGQFLHVAAHLQAERRHKLVAVVPETNARPRLIPTRTDAAVLPPEPNGLRPGEAPMLDDHPFDAAWLAAELARWDAEITAVVLSSDSHPPDPEQSLADLLRNRVAEFEAG